MSSLRTYIHPTFNTKPCSIFETAPPNLVYKFLNLSSTHPIGIPLAQHEKKLATYFTFITRATRFQSQSNLAGLFTLAFTMFMSIFTQFWQKHLENFDSNDKRVVRELRENDSCQREMVFLTLKANSTLHLMHQFYKFLTRRSRTIQHFMRSFIGK